MHRSKWLLRTVLVGTLAMGLHAASPSSAIAQGFLWSTPRISPKISSNSGR